MWEEHHALGTVREQRGPVWVDGGWEDAGESWDLIGLEGWVVGMCADSKEMEGSSRTIHSFS